MIQRFGQAARQCLPPNLIESYYSPFQQSHRAKPRNGVSGPVAPHLSSAGQYARGDGRSAVATRCHY